MSTRSIATSPPLPPWLAGLLLAFVPWAVCIWTGSALRTRLLGVVEVGFLLVLLGFCVWNLWQATRRIELPMEFRGALRWIAAGFMAMLLGALYVLVHDVLLRSTREVFSLGLADLLFMGAYPLIIAGQLLLPRGGRRAASPWRVAADSAIFICGVGVPLWVFAFRPALSHLGGMATFVSLAFALLAFAGIVTTNFALLRCVPLPSRRAFNLLILGIATSWVADLVFTLAVTARMQIPNSGHAANLLNAMSLLMVLTGAWWIRRDSRTARPLPPAAFSPIPMVTILVMTVWLAGYLHLHVFQVSKETLGNILLGVIVLLFVLLLREGLAARESLRQATEAARMAMKARFEALVEHSTDLIMIVDRTGRLMSASPAVVRYFGAPEAALQGIPLVGFIHPSDLEAWDHFLAELLNRSEFRTTQQWRMRDLSGEWRAFDISGSNLLETPEVEGLVLNARDITDRHTLEEQQYKAVKMEALGRLAGVIAHDFNNLLSAILGNIELAEMNPSDARKLSDRLARIRGAATHGANLTDRLASFTRRGSSVQTTLGAKQILEAVLPLAKGLLGEQIELVVQEEPGAGCFRANRDDIEQVLVSLLNNARDAMPEGGRITVAFRNAETLDSDQTLYLAPASAPYLLVEVTDTGAGMDEVVLSHLFEPFFTTKGSTKATGLGLTGVYGIVKACSGGIGIRSSPGEGTTMRLWFPRVVSTAEASPRPPSITSIHGSETLLLVEDEAMLRDALQEILESLGYTVHVAGDAQQARTFLADFQGKLDLLVTDVIMPGDSGPKLAAELVKTRADLRVIYISGYTADELVSHGLAHPGALLLEKPFTREQIGRRIREVLA
ncbi:MAG: response regulator [Geothrix sp.]|nr:response regulator [Geothrix sp.]